MRFLLPPDRGMVSGAARAAVLADWMSSWLGEEVTVDIVPSYSALAQELESGRAQLAWAPPAVCARIRGGARTLLTAIRDGRGDYAAALVVRADAGIQGLGDLRGKRASWVDPLSTSGHLLAVAFLEARGLPARELFAEQRFAGSLRDALIDVVERRADVTSVYMIADDEERTRAELREVAGAAADELRILSRTDYAPFDALIVGTDAPPGLERRLLQLDRRTGAPAMLLEICRADRFVIAEANDYLRFGRFVVDHLG